MLMAAQFGKAEYLNNLIRKAERSEVLEDIIRKSATPIPLYGVKPISKAMMNGPGALMAAQF